MQTFLLMYKVRRNKNNTGHVMFGVNTNKNSR